MNWLSTTSTDRLPPSETEAIFNLKINSKLNSSLYKCKDHFLEEATSAVLLEEF